MAPVLCLGVCGLVYLLLPPVDVVILGVDARPGQGYLTRTDSIMLLGVTPRRLDVGLLSIPRDLFIEVPGYGLQRINTVNVLGEQQSPGGGPALIQASLEQSFMISVERYVRLDFDGFIALIDAIGGVEIEVPKRIVDRAYPTPGGGTTALIFEPGWQHMDGQTALGYARTRHSDDDYQRASRQQQVVNAVATRLLIPVYWPTVWLTLRRYMDTDMKLVDMAAVAPALLFNSLRGIDRLVIDRDYIGATPNGNAMPRYEALEPWLSQHFH